MEERTINPMKSHRKIVSPGGVNNVAWIAGEEGGKKEQNRLEKVRPGLGLRRFGELGAQRQGFRDKHTGSIWKNAKDCKQTGL